jgi:hypothetical protein
MRTRIYCLFALFYCDATLSEIDFASVPYLSRAPFSAGREESLLAGTQCKQAHALRSNQPARPSSRTENYARLGVGHALSMTIATAHYLKELYANENLRHEHWSHSIQF